MLIKDEAGWSIDERMRRHKVEAVSVAVVKEFQVVWTEARGFADREGRVPATTQTLFQSLAEVYLMSGDRAKALEIYRKELEVLPGDTKTEPGLKDRLRRIAEGKLKELAQ